MRKILFLIFAAYVVISVFGPKQEGAQATSSPPAQAAKTPEQEAAEQAENKRFYKAVMVATAIKTSLRDPDSLKWASIYANDDASVLCVEYRARNGFGGMNFEQITYAKNKLRPGATAWNQNCAKKSFHDMLYAARALK